MRISWIKSVSDEKNFKVPEMLGFDVFSLDDVEKIDDKIDELIRQQYHTIVITKDLAGFSQKINHEYIAQRGIEIIISTR